MIAVRVSERLDETEEKMRMDVAEEENRRLERVYAPRGEKEVGDGVSVRVVVDSVVVGDQVAEDGAVIDGGRRRIPEERDAAFV